MKRTIFILLVIIFFSLQMIHSDIKIDKIAIVKLDQVINEVFSGKSGPIKAQKREKERFQQLLDSKKEKIMDLESRKKKESDPDKIKSIQEKIDNLKIDYTKFYKEKSKELESKKEAILGPILKEIYDIIKYIAETEGYTLILNYDPNSILYNSLENDITQKVLDILEKRYGEKEEDEKKEN